MDQARKIVRRAISDIDLPTESSIRREGITSIFIDLMLLGRAKNYSGCYSDDTLPYNLHLLKSFVLVCNLSKSYDRGSHFVTIVKSQRYMYYIDSFGRPPPPKCDGIHSFLKASSIPVFVNYRQLQHPESSFCGFFAILFCLLYSNSENDGNLVHESEFPLFHSDDLRKNDQLCLKHICKFTREWMK